MFVSCDLCVLLCNSQSVSCDSHVDAAGWVSAMLEQGDHVQTEMAGEKERERERESKCHLCITGWMALSKVCVYRTYTMHTHHHLLLEHIQKLYRKL